MKVGNHYGLDGCGNTSAAYSLGTEMVQRLLTKVTRNKHIYEIVSRELGKVGVERNWKQCRDRIKMYKRSTERQRMQIARVRGHSYLSFLQ